MDSQGTEGEAIAKVTRRHVDRWPRRKCLASVCDGPDSGAVVHHAAEVVLVPRTGLADQHTRSERQTRVASALQRRRCGDRSGRLREHREMAVALAPRLHHRSRMGRNDRLDIEIEAGHGRFRLIGRAVPRLGARFDVGQQEGHDP